MACLWKTNEGLRKWGEILMHITHPVERIRLSPEGAQALVSAQMVPTGLDVPLTSANTLTVSSKLVMAMTYEAVSAARM